MSGRRRRDDDWDDGGLDDGRDPWADSSVDEWGNRDQDGDFDADRSGGRHGGHTGAAAYVNNGSSAKGYAAPSFPSFSSVNVGAKPAAPADGSRGSDRRGADAGYGDSGYGQRGASERSAGGGAGGAGYGSAGYNNAGYDSGGYGRSGQGEGRRDAGYGNDSAGAYSARGQSAGGRGANGYGAAGYGAGGRGNDSGYGGAPGFAAANGRSVGFAPEFTPSDSGDPDDEGSSGTPRPIGRLSIYTLHEDKAREFDRLAERAAEGVRAAEPDTLVYVIHVVPKAPMQRIIYEIYRDRAAYLSHEQQPHIRQFAKDRASCVLATNIIDLRLKYAKVAALGAPADAAPQQPAQAPGGDRYAAPASQYSPGQYPPQGAATVKSATFTPSGPVPDRSQGGGQYPSSSGRDQYGPDGQQANAGNGAYGAGNGQYGAAGNGQYGAANGYSGGGGGYSNGGGYQGASAYPGSNGYPAGSDYQRTNGYSGADGYSNGNSYGSGRSYPGASGYQNGAGNGYGSGGYAGNGGRSNGDQYTPRYRELTSGAPDGNGEGRPADAGRYPDDGRQSSRTQAPEWSPYPQDRR